MKPLLATIALLLVSGCASKPITCKSFGPESLSGVLYVCTGTKWVPESGYGEARHVTREQWEAAQGLYTWDLITKDSYEVVDWNGLTEFFKCTDDNNDPIDCKAYLHEWQGRILDFEPSVGLIGDTSPPSGDAK